MCLDAPRGFLDRDLILSFPVGVSYRDLINRSEHGQKCLSHVKSCFKKHREVNPESAGVKGWTYFEALKLIHQIDSGVPMAKAFEDYSHKSADCASEPY